MEEGRPPKRPPTTAGTGPIAFEVDEESGGVADGSSGVHTALGQIGVRAQHVGGGQPPGRTVVLGVPQTGQRQEGRQRVVVVRVDGRIASKPLEGGIVGPKGVRDGLLWIWLSSSGFTPYGSSPSTVRFAIGASQIVRSAAT